MEANIEEEMKRFEDEISKSDPPMLHPPPMLSSAESKSTNRTKEASSGSSSTKASGSTTEVVKTDFFPSSHQMLNMNTMPPPMMPPMPCMPFPPFPAPMFSDFNFLESQSVYSSGPVLKKRKAEEAAATSSKITDLSILKAASMIPKIPQLQTQADKDILLQKANYISQSKSGSYANNYQYPSPSQRKSGKSGKKKKMIRTAAGQKWEDPSLDEWDPNDYRIFCGDLGNEVTDDTLARVFTKYSSFQKARVVRDKNTNKSRGYGFVSMKDPSDFIRAIREMNGKYVGNRPIKLRKSNWKERNIENVRKKTKERKKLGYKV